MTTSSHRSTAPPDQVLASAMPCRHRGRQLETIDCNRCTARHARNVYVCEIYGRCTLARCRREINPCHCCRKRQP